VSEADGVASGLSRSYESNRAGPKFNTSRSESLFKVVLSNVKSVCMSWRSVRGKRAVAAYLGLSTSRDGGIALEVEKARAS
jgi:hypothetical protein